MRTRDGVSATHGGHQLAQKFNTTTCPLNWLRVTLRSASWTTKSGAALPIRGGLRAAIAARHYQRA